MNEIYSVTNIEQLRALSDPHRLTILRQLMQDPATITQVGRRLNEEPAKVRYHVKELERAGLVQLVEKREKGGALEKYYQAIARSFALNITVISADGREDDLNSLALRIMKDLTAELGTGLVQHPLLPPPSGGWPVFHGVSSVRMSDDRADAFAEELRRLLERFKALDEDGNAAPYGLAALLYRSSQEAVNTILAIGSHDLTLDLLARRLSALYPGHNLSLINAGSLDGLVALHRGAAHLAGCHLLDADTGEYNIPYVRRLLPGKSTVLINLVYRQQGLMVLSGNPKNISGLQDLLQSGVTFVNREQGSGTRVLLDRKLREAGLDPSKIDGYDREEFTHLAVASAIVAGTADAGLGILAAARTYGLGFIPLAKERYDLVIPRAYYESDFMQPLLALLRSEAFKAEVEGLGGYDTSEMGQVVAELHG